MSPAQKRSILSLQSSRKSVKDSYSFKKSDTYRTYSKLCTKIIEKQIKFSFSKSPPNQPGHFLRHQRHADRPPQSLQAGEPGLGLTTAELLRWAALFLLPSLFLSFRVFYRRKLLKLHTQYSSRKVFLSSRPLNLIENKTFSNSNSTMPAGF